MTEFEKIKSYTLDEMARYLLTLITAAQIGNVEIAKILLDTTPGRERLEEVKATLLQEADE